MEKSWQGSKVDVYFGNPEGEGFIRRGFNNLIQDPSNEQIGAFAEAINQLSELSTEHVIVSESSIYVH